MNRITVFHYHLLPGGVTNVIVLGTIALIRHFPDLQLLRIVCGKGENTNIVKKQIEKEIDATGLTGSPLRFEVCIEPDIDYSGNGGTISQDKIKELAGKLLKLYGDSFWWIHNYQLGKNPLLTAAVIHITAAENRQKILLHVHDFPECARYDNLERLLSAGVRNPYPVSDNIAYALINGRDAAALKSAGIPEDRVFLLNNPVEDSGTDIAPLPEDRIIQLKTDFYEHYSGIFPGVKPDAKMMFYPVRTIRRKNVLEAGLIAAVSERPVNLVLSLPGVSMREQKYSDTCEKCFRDGLIPGVWGSGIDGSPAVPDYPVMFQLADLVLSASVQEGFGYLFINSVMLGIPLTARDLDILDGIRSVFPAEHTCFYSNFSVPVAYTEIEELKKQYRRKLDYLRSYVSKQSEEGISNAINSMGENGTVDFSYLTVEQQVHILKQVKESSESQDEIHSINKTLMASVYNLLENGKYKAQADMTAFSLKAHADKVREIMEQLYSCGSADLNVAENVQQNLIDRFAEPEYMRLIYDY